MAIVPLPEANLLFSSRRFQGFAGKAIAIKDSLGEIKLVYWVKGASGKIVNPILNMRFHVDFREPESVKNFFRWFIALCKYNYDCWTTQGTGKGDSSR